MALPFEVMGSLLMGLKPGVYYPFVEWKHNDRDLGPAFAPSMANLGRMGQE